MSIDFLKILRERSLQIKLKADPRFGGAVDIQSLIKALDAISKSFSNYLEAELRLEYPEQQGPTFEKEIKVFKKESALLVVDLNFASFGASISPNSVTTKPFALLKKPQALKEQLFEHYKEDAFYCDHSDAKTVARLEKKFTPDQRAGIFNPLYKGVFDAKGFDFYVGSSTGKLKKVVTVKNKTFRAKLMPEIITEISPETEKLVVLHAKAVGETDLFGQRQLKITKQLAVEEMQHPDYPYQVHDIVYSNVKIKLKKTISADVEYDEEEDNLFIGYPDLDINVWADTREQAEEAFNFAFVQLAKNFYSEDDNKLTPKARKLKQKLSGLIKDTSGI